MSRLPNPGSDDGVWGDVLNDFLLQSHKTDGTLKNGAVSASSLASGAVRADSLATGAGSDGQALVKDSFSVGGFKWSTVSGGTTPPATTTTVGTIQLAGDLAGTATAPTVPALDDKADISHTHAIADTTGLQTALNDKAAAVHSHTIANVTGLQTALDDKATSTHTHAVGDVTNLQDSLDAKLDDSQLDADSTLVANSDTKIATQKATKAYVDAKVVGTNMYVYQNYADAPALPVDTVVISRTGL